jgi:hypothetical protein
MGVVPHKIIWEWCPIIVPDKIIWEWFPIKLYGSGAPVKTYE